VPKRENFSLAVSTLSEPIWVCDLGTGKKSIFYYLAPDFEDFRFLPHAESALGRPKLKVCGGCFWVHMYTYNVFYEKFPGFGSFMND
jgi:hypothetical protein